MAPEQGNPQGQKAWLEDGWAWLMTEWLAETLG